MQVSDHSVIASSLVSESRPFGVDGTGHRDGSCLEGQR